MYRLRWYCYAILNGGRFGDLRTIYQGCRALPFALAGLSCSGGLQRTISFLQEWRFSRSRSYKVIDFGTNRKRVCDFPSARNSNPGPILHRFVWDILQILCAPESWPHPYSTLILGCSPCTRSPMLGSASAKALSYSAVKLFSKYIPTCVKNISTSRTDRRHANLITAFCVAYRAVKIYHYRYCNNNK